MYRCFCWILLATLLSGCSVGMALSGGKDPYLGMVRVGATRGEIEMQLGSPVEIQAIEGHRTDLYAYEVGNEPSAGRAIVHGTMDVLTLGLWELVGTPVEGVQGDKKYLSITYDENDVVTKIDSNVSPASR